VEAPSTATAYALESELADAQRPVKLLGNVLSLIFLMTALAAGGQLFDRYANHGGVKDGRAWLEWVGLVFSLANVVIGVLLIRHSQSLIFAGKLSTAWKVTQFESAFRTQSRLLAVMGFSWALIFLMVLAGLGWEFYVFRQR